MTRIRSSTWLLSLLLFFATAACLFAAELMPSAGVPSSGSGAAGAPAFLKEHWAKLWIPVAVPSLLALLKELWPRVPKVLLPYLCPVLGAALSYLTPLITGQQIDPVLAAALGAVGNNIREMYHESRKALPTTNAPYSLAFSVGFFLFFAFPAVNARATEDQMQRISVSPFASYRLHETADDQLGAGLAVGFALTRHVTIEAETLSERLDDSDWIGSLAEAGANLKLYALPGKRLNPYALLGYTRNLQVDENRMNAGLGAELSLGKHFALFGDGRWTHDFDTKQHALFRLGGTLKF